MRRVLAVGTILVSAMAARAATSGVPATAETGSMFLIGVGLVAAAVVVRQKKSQKSH